MVLTLLVDAGVVDAIVVYISEQLGVATTLNILQL